MAIQNNNYKFENNLDLIFIDNINLYINTDYVSKNKKLLLIKKNLIINQNNYECPICYNNVELHIQCICGHSYCIACFLKIDTCAICRRNII